MLNPLLVQVHLLLHVLHNAHARCSFQNCHSCVDDLSDFTSYILLLSSVNISIESYFYHCALFISQLSYKIVTAVLMI